MIEMVKGNIFIILAKESGLRNSSIVDKNLNNTCNIITHKISSSVILKEGYVSIYTFRSPYDS